MNNVLRNPLVLPEDVMIIPVKELSDEVRNRLGDCGEEFAITRPLAREPSKLIDAAGARLIEQFREPQTIVQAVFSYSRASKTNAERTLEDSLPLLRQMLASGLLLPAGAAEARRIEATYASGDDAASYRIIRCLQTFDDSELYQARDERGKLVALKIARKESAVSMQARLDREIAALGRLSGVASPRLIDHGAVNERPFLVTEWISGADILTASAALRASNDRRALMKFIVEIARAYATSHQLGVLHGDVHPGNVLIGRNETATLIDFGQAQIESEPAEVFRGGVGFFMEPEYAKAFLEERPLPQATAKGEQFAVAALLYMAATGHHYMDFTLQQEKMFRQIRHARPLSFAQRNIEPWPELEAVLARALAVAPAKRFPDMASFAETLATTTPPISLPALWADHGIARFLKSTLDHVGLDSNLYRDGLGAGPLCSINFGAGGIAYAFYRLACQRDDPRLLAAADAWIMKAQAEADMEAAFYNEAMQLTEDTIGRVSLYNGLPGVYLVRSMIADASGESATCDGAVRAFLRSSELRSLGRDLTLGRSGAVLGCAILLENLPAAESIRHDVRKFGQRRLSDLWAETAGFESISCGKQWPNLGIAHGWAGLLYITLRWHDLVGHPIPAGVQDRLTELIGAASVSGRGLAWPWRERPDDDSHASMPGWCNGSAGMVHLFCLAHRLLGADAFLDAAEGAAWHAWEAGDGGPDLCCGCAGRAYALLELHRSTSDENWLKRAQLLAERGVEMAPQVPSEIQPRHSLYKGELGLALLLSDLEDPKSAAMPLFASERLRSGS